MGQAQLAPLGGIPVEAHLSPSGVVVGPALFVHLHVGLCTRSSWFELPVGYRVESVLYG